MSPEEEKALAELQVIMAQKRSELDQLRQKAAEISEKRNQVIAEIAKSKKARELMDAKAAGFETPEEYAADQQNRAAEIRRLELCQTRLNAAGFPPVHLRAIQDRVALSEQQTAVLAGVAAAISVGAVVAVVGNRGTGKTLLACKLASERVMGMSVKYAKTLDFFRDLRDTFRRDSLLTERDVISAYVRPGLLILDECHERTGTEWESVQLVDLIDRRYSAGDRPTILLSNQQRAALAENLGPSVCSRIRETGDVFELTGDSFREAIRRERIASHA